MTATKTSRKKSKTSTKAKNAKTRKTSTTKLYAGAPIPCNRLCYRKMTEFKNCQAWAWMPSTIAKERHVRQLIQPRLRHPQGEL